MAISIETSRNDYVGNDSLSSYAFDFRITAKSHLKVMIRDASGVEFTPTVDVDYSVDGVGDEAGGTISLINSSQAWLTAGGNLKTGYALMLRRKRPITQDTSFRNQGSSYRETQEIALDAVVHISQQQQDEIERSLKLPETLKVSGFSPKLPSSLPAGSVLRVNDAGDGMDVGPTIADLNQVAVDATAAAASAAAAATSEANAATSETNAATSESNAAASAAAAATSAANAATSETNAAASAAAAATSATNAAGSETNALAAKTAAEAAQTAAEAAATAAVAAASSVGSSVIKTVTHADSPYSVDAVADSYLLFDASAGAIVVNAPAAAGHANYSFRGKRIDATANTVDVNFADSVDGDPSFSFTDQWQSREFKTDGSTYYVF